MNRHARARAVADLYLSSAVTPEPQAPTATSTPDQLRAFVGVYQERIDGDVWQVTLKGARLHAELHGRSLELRPTGPRSFTPVDYFVPTALQFEPDGASKRLVVVQGTHTRTMQAVRVVTPSSDALRAYVGDYWSDELRSTYRIGLKDGSLWLTELIGADEVRRAGIVPFDALRPLSADLFDLRAAMLVFRFVRDARGGVTGFVLNGFGERGFTFARRAMQVAKRL